MAQDIGQHIARRHRQGDTLFLYNSRGAPGREAIDSVALEIASANQYVKFGLVPRAQVSTGDHLALSDEHHFVARDLDFAEQMGIEKYRGSALPLGPQDVANEPPPIGSSPEVGSSRKINSGS
jgi:hypothetical protein